MPSILNQAIFQIIDWSPFIKSIGDDQTSSFFKGISKTRFCRNGFAHCGIDGEKVSKLLQISISYKSTTHNSLSWIWFKSIPL